MSRCRYNENHWGPLIFGNSCMFKNIIKFILLCYREERNSYMFWTTWRMIFRWTIPLTFDSVHCRRTSTLMMLPVSWWRTSFSTIKVFHMKRAMVTRLNWTNKQCLLRVSPVVASVGCSCVSHHLTWKGGQRPSSTNPPIPPSSQTPATDHSITRGQQFVL